MPTECVQQRMDRLLDEAHIAVENQDGGSNRVPGRGVRGLARRIPLFLLITLAAGLFFAACASDEDDGDISPSATTQVSTSPAATETLAPEVATPTPRPEFEGYSLGLSEGDFWEYRWSFVDRSCAQGRGCSTDKDSGVFRVTLGEQRNVGGVPLYRLIVTGSPVVGLPDESRDFAPRWLYLGAADDRIFVSNGTDLTVLFDGVSGKWAGSGYFTDRFDEDELVVARKGRLDQSFEIAGWSGVNPGPWEFVGRAASQSQCETIEGLRICPREESFSFTESEYYRSGVGPVAYRFHNTASFSGGGFFSSFETTEWVALVASSLRGDAGSAALSPSPPSPTAPAPIAPTSAPAEITFIFGPVDGSLPLVPGSDQISDFSTGVSLDAAIVQVQFTNPQITDGRWSYGLSFRQSEEETFHAVYISGDGQWGHFARAGSGSSEFNLGNGTGAFNLRSGESNLLTLVFEATEGLFFVNGEQVAELDLELPGARAPGDIRVMAGLLATDHLDGSEILYTGFVIAPPE